ncbi:MAG: hypothetical protein F4110_10395 [Acidimicrobiaceae bacterium]|nr:hypothetical protein [Gammaproteobacteria bacterium]MXW95506.1 hypothetical protein [Acidimicrobiaceae bacterium]MYE96771.1 hypothetical protein [Acidimicrobiaceae bacterium]MYI54372.1 hypothetical protein [Acidimicrobiaceae bacterium]
MGEGTGRGSLTFEQLKQMIVEMRGTEPEVADQQLQLTVDALNVVLLECGGHGSAYWSGALRDVDWPPA